MLEGLGLRRASGAIPLRSHSSTWQWTFGKSRSLCNVLRSRSLSMEIGSTRHALSMLPLLLTVSHFRPSAKLQSGGAERPALGVRGGADAAPAAGGARRFPAGAAPVQLPAPVRSPAWERGLPLLWQTPPCDPAPASPAHPRQPFGKPPPAGWGRHCSARVALLPWGKTTGKGGAAGDASTFTPELPSWEQDDRMQGYWAEGSHLGSGIRSATSQGSRGPDGFFLWKMES